MKQIQRKEIVITHRMAQKIALAPSIDRALDRMFERQKENHRARLGVEESTDNDPKVGANPTTFTDDVRPPAVNQVTSLTAAVRELVLDPMEKSLKMLPVLLLHIATLGLSACTPPPSAPTLLPAPGSFLVCTPDHVCQPAPRLP